MTTVLVREGELQVYNMVFNANPKLSLNIELHLCLSEDVEGGTDGEYSEKKYHLVIGVDKNRSNIILRDTDGEVRNWDLDQRANTSSVKLPLRHEHHKDRILKCDDVCISPQHWYQG